MNPKIIEKLEYKRITNELSNFAITEPAKKAARQLLPSSDYDEVKRMIAQTQTLSNILRIKGPLPITDFNDVQTSLKRLKIKADLNSTELGNIFLVLDLTQDVNNFIADFEDREIDSSAISEYLNKLIVPTELYQRLTRAISSDGEILDSASPELSRIRKAIKANEAEIKNKMNSFIKGKNSQYLSEQIITIRDGRYVVPVKQAYKNKFGGVIHDTTRVL